MVHCVDMVQERSVLQDPTDLAFIKDDYLAPGGMPTTDLDRLFLRGHREHTLRIGHHGKGHVRVEGMQVRTQ